jgi:DNA-binding transcriptional regulator YiaG
MTPEQLSEALAALGLTQAGYARLIDVSQKTVWMWISGRTPVPKLASEHLKVLLALNEVHQRFLGIRPESVQDSTPPSAT